ncbi:ISL3 family transposase [Haloactinopolyspora alba]|nr:ISL3 family transposase [Haloactinopolyspora alba]
MRSPSLWRALLGVEKTVVEEVEYDENDEVVVAHVRPRRAKHGRCGACGRCAPWFDRGEGRRRWRALDLGTVRVFLEADAPRVTCQVHGPTVRQMPWARHGAGHTHAFDQQVAWLATQCSKSAVTALMRIAWRTVGSIVTRVCADIDARVDRLSGLRRIGIDEVSYRKGKKFLTVVVDHDTGRLVWARPGRDAATLRVFFDELGAERSAQLTHVSADTASWIANTVATRAPQAVVCADPFHIVAWATQCLDDVRREVWNEARRKPGGTKAWGSHAGLRHNTSRGNARKLQRSRYALWKNPEDLTENQRAKLEWIAATSPKLHRAYLLKEGLRHVFKVKGEQGKQALQQWLAWASRSRINVFVVLGRKIRRHLPAIHATLTERMSNAIVESVNTKIRLLTRVAFGFHGPEPLIALTMLNLGGYRPNLPGRT